MSYQTLLVDYNEKNILLVTINRPQALNALNKVVFDELHQLFSTDIYKFKELKGVVITGSGEKAFVAGADITEFTGITAPEEGYNLSKKGHNVFFLIERFAKPVVAAINGFALGGGCELAMACHLRVAAENAKFGQPEVNLGLTPGYGGTQRLVQLIGKSKALELLITAQIIPAAIALQYGLVNYLTPVGQSIEKATELVELIASKAPIAVARCINAVNAYYNEKEDGFDRECREFAACCETQDFKEGASAFIEKRPAKFRGV